MDYKDKLMGIHKYLVQNGHFKLAQNILYYMSKKTMVMLKLNYQEILEYIVSLADYAAAGVKAGR